MIEDSDLTFDKDTKRYYLTNNYVFNKLGTDIAVVAYDDLDTNLATLNKRVIEYACDMLYDFLEDNAVSRESSLYYVTQDKDAHIAMKKALGYQLLHFIQNGDLSNEIGHKVSETVNNRAIQTLKAKNVFHVKYRQIPDDVEQW